MDLIKQIQITNKELITIHVDKTTYYQGYIRSDQPLTSVKILDANKLVVKTLLTSTGKESEIFWFIEQVGNYHIEIIVNQCNEKTVNTKNNKLTNIKLSLTSLTLKNSQYLSVPNPILSPLIEKVSSNIQQKIETTEDSFWQKILKVGTPLVEEYDHNNALMTFLYKGNVNNVKVFGTPYEGHTHLTQIANSSIWYKSFIVPKTTRLSYRVAANVPQLTNGQEMEQRRAVLATAQSDPLNQHALFSEHDDLFGSASTVTLNAAPSDKYTIQKNVAQGSVKDFIHTSKQIDLNNNSFISRNVSIYLPNIKYTTDKTSPLLILFDGDAYLTKVPTPIILDNLIADGVIPPTRAVFINNPLPSMRGKELTPNKTFSDYMANELMPWLSQEHGIDSLAPNTILSGSSFGGLASLHIAFQYPDIFGKVLSQSGSFWWSPTAQDSLVEHTKGNWFAELITTSIKKEITIYLNAGLFEIQPESHNILKSNQELYDALNASGYNVRYEEFASGHDYFSWRVTLANGLINLLSR